MSKYDCKEGSYTILALIQLTLIAVMENDTNTVMLRTSLNISKTLRTDVFPFFPVNHDFVRNC